VIIIDPVDIVTDKVSSWCFLFSFCISPFGGVCSCDVLSRKAVIHPASLSECSCSCAPRRHRFHFAFVGTDVRLGTFFFLFVLRTTLTGWHYIVCVCLFVSVFVLTCCTCRGVFLLLIFFCFVSGVPEWRVWTDCGKCALELCSL